jgi:signal transduction histidine kinase/CheY-like chemotaxis protein
MKNDIFYLDSHHNVVVFLLSDVTAIFEQERESRERLKTALLAANQASSAKTNFLSRMSHEIRTPLNAIIGMGTIAAQSMGNPEKTADCIAKIGLSARYLLSLINDILDMSRIESGKMLLKNDRFSFPEFVSGVNNMIYPQARSKGIDYECTVSSEICDSYIGDEMKLQQVLVNVLGNAVKFTEKGKISLDISMLGRDQKQEKIRFVINDTGCGIAEANLSRIFDAFEQVDTSTTTVFGGTGLGLAITKNLVALMGGNISVRSIVGVGSEFTIDVPLTVDTASLRAPKLQPNLQNLHVLIVDDDLMICEQALDVLKEIGMIGEWVTSGREAVACVRVKSESKKYYDFILIDWKMPDMDGIETTQRIRKMVGPDVTIIIISAYDWQSIEVEARAAGANMMISKPLLRSTLISAFEQALGEEKNAERPKLNFDFTGKRILVAEDNDLNAEIAKTLLEDKHFAVDRVPNGLKVLEKFVKSPQGTYDAILTDVRMPLMDGLQATMNIRHWDRPDAKIIPIIAMPVNAFDEDVEKSRATGMNAHPSKPIDPELMYSTLQHVLNKFD